eukprot:NODE_1257_length_1020_cov_83.222451_g874_i0.p2 GENE.NODE_1257_length_1020_cov_83.222451_g874_i0~~NODE_1257_length_1020_cov_83.222451_g874_i0.p2  ORF type:complete len:80 (-),score=0.01 NODE_1257_length_1020_cov_83.222451_g874_i0:161-400(-)
MWMSGSSKRVRKGVPVSSPMFFFVEGSAQEIATINISENSTHPTREGGGKANILPENRVLGREVIFFLFLTFFSNQILM